MLNERARDIGDKLARAHQAERQAKADKVLLMAELAESYVIPRGAAINHGYLVDELEEEMFTFGGPGAPLISEYVVPEIAALLAVSARKARMMIEGAVHLKWQLPWMMNQVMDLHIDADRAVQASYRVVDLPEQLKQAVIQQWARVQRRYTWAGALKKLDDIIAELDPTRAKKETDRLGTRHVKIDFGTLDENQALGWVNATLDVVDAKLFDAAVNQIADLLKSVQGDTSSKDIRRARAFGVLSRPAYALALIQQGAKHLAPEELPIEPVDEYGNPLHGTVSERYLPAGCAGHVCGTIDVPLDRLQPKVNVEVVVEADAIAADSVARIDDATLIATETLAEVLSGKTVQLRPVIDLPRLPDEDQYRPSVAMRRAVRLRWPFEAFPYSTSRSKGLDLDHVRSYLSYGPPGQTGLKKLIPLSRRVHRAKTAKIFRIDLDEDGRPIWTSPLGYRYLVTPNGTDPLLPVATYRRLERIRRQQRRASAA